MSCGETSDYGWVRLHHCHHHYRYQHHNGSTIFFLLPWNSVQLYPRYACRPLPSLATQSLASLVTQEGEHELLEEPVEERQEVSFLQLWGSCIVWTCKVVKIWSLTLFESKRELSSLGIILMLLLFYGVSNQTIWTIHNESFIFAVLSVSFMGVLSAG